MEPQPVASVSVTLTPQQWEAIQELLNQRRLPQPVFPLASGTITFDEFPNLQGPIPNGTELVQHQPYAVTCGVTFSRPDPGRGVFVRSDPTGRTRNVVTVIDDMSNPGYFSGDNGTIRASFNPPVKSVSIDACPRFDGSTGWCPQNQPYIEAIDANGVMIAGTRQLDQVPGCTSGNTAVNPAWNDWTTLPTITRPQADIYAVDFATTGPDVYAVFDNLTFHR